MGAVSREAEARERAEARAAGVAILIEELSGVTPAMLEAGSLALPKMTIILPARVLRTTTEAQLAAKLRGQGT